MDSDTASKISALVAAQLAAHAAQEKEARDRLYEMIAGLASSSTKLAKNVNSIAADAEMRSAELIKAFADGFTERVLPMLLARTDGATSAKSDPATNAAVADSIYVGVRDLMTRSLEPIARRLEAVEQRLPRDR